MIVVDLVCPDGHRFEAWFASGEIFSAQCAAGQINCPHCDSVDVRRIPAGAHLVKGGARPQAANSAEAGHAAGAPVAALRALIDQIRAGSEDVGDRFVEEVRRIHYAEAPERAIRGRATAAECQELHDEGIAVLALPSLPPARLN